MYNLFSLNWHVSVSQNNYTSKQGFCCGFMSLMLIQTVKLKLESDMHLDKKKILVKFGLLVLTRNVSLFSSLTVICINRVYMLLGKILSACTSIVFTI